MLTAAFLFSWQGVSHSEVRLLYGFVNKPCPRLHFSHCPGVAVGDCVPPAQCTQMTQGNKGGNCHLLAGLLPTFGLLEE